MNPSSPPYARLALRIGVTGHRPNNLKSAKSGLLHRQIHAVLEYLRAATFQLHKKEHSGYRSDPPVLRVISPLAEGSDRLVAEVAKASAYEFELQCPLPFAIAEYESDFQADESRAEFRKLLSMATAVLELDGSHETTERRDQSYEAVGRMVLNQSDVVIAIWDGEKTDLRGGTSQIMDEASRLGIPLIWIDSKTPHAISLKLEQDEDWLDWKNGAARLFDKLENLLMQPPQPVPKESKKIKPDLRKAYFKEPRRRWKSVFLWKLFRDVMVFRLHVARVEPGSPARLPQAMHDQIESALGLHFAWADQLANYYADVYRSAFVFNYLMSACAVLFAFLGYVLHENQPAFNIAEVLIILAIIVVTLFGTKRRWHERWIDYRLLAEQLRQARFLMALGRVSVSVPRLPAHISYGDPRHSWMYWHLRALLREAGMITARFDARYLETVKDSLNENGIKAQIRYHEPNAERLEKVNHRLHHLGIILFLSAFIAAFLHFFIHEEEHRPVLTLITIVGPAFGAALAAIRSQGEFDRLTKRSQAMTAQLKRVSHQLDRLTLDDGDLSSLKLSEIAINGAQLMVDEVLDWRIVFQERPLDWPS
jgi:hypothetical protein